jgi:hypothetical protein
MDESQQTDRQDARPADAQLLLAYLSNRDVGCPLCEYNLRGLTSPRCPECGRELKLSVGLVEPYLRAWMLLAFAIFAAAGIGLLFLMVLIHNEMPGRFLEWVSFTYFIANIPVAIIVALGRRRFMRWPQRTQWPLAWAAAALTVAGLVAFAISIR